MSCCVIVEPAEVVFHAEEHVDERARRAVPVHALVVIEALVLDGDRRLFEIRRQLVVIDPDAVLVRCQHRKLYGLAVVIVGQTVLESEMA